MLHAERGRMIRLGGEKHEFPGAPGTRRARPGTAVVCAEASGGAIANSGIESV